MTESPGNEPGSALFARIQQMVSERGVDIRQNLNGNALRLEFADGQRILINFDAQTHNVWLAARSGGIEFIHRDGTWRAHDQNELFARLREIMEQTIASNPLNARAPTAKVPQAVLPTPSSTRSEGEPWPAQCAHRGAGRRDRFLGCAELNTLARPSGLQRTRTDSARHCRSTS